MKITISIEFGKPAPTKATQDQDMYFRQPDQPGWLRARRIGENRYNVYVCGSRELEEQIGYGESWAWIANYATSHGYGGWTSQ